MNPRLASRISAAAGFLGVALGAFGAHALKTRLALLQTAGVWETAVLYHLVHAVMLLLLAGRARLAVAPWGAFLAGIVLFSGSLYVLACTKAHWLWPFAPLGGLCFLAGWLLLAIRGLPE